jgi:hypothetical protein
MIQLNDEYPVEFSVLPFEVLDLLIKIKKKQAFAIKKQKRNPLQLGS